MLGSSGFFNWHPEPFGFTVNWEQRGRGRAKPQPGGASYQQKLAEMVLFAANQTFKISKLQNYITDVNETWSTYVPPRHLPLAGK